MHKSRLAGFIIDCQTMDLAGAADFWGAALGMQQRQLPSDEADRYVHLVDPLARLNIEVQTVTHPSRVQLDIETDVVSDTAPLNGLVADLLGQVAGSGGGGVRALRDATRGGVATILNEIARAAGVGILVTEDDIPVRDEVRGASELLGIDPMYVACEGRLVAVVDGQDADRALGALRAHPLGEQAAIIGRVTAEPPGIVQLKTAFGGTRIVDMLVGDPLPRIC